MGSNFALLSKRRDTGPDLLICASNNAPVLVVIHFEIESQIPISNASNENFVQLRVQMGVCMCLVHDCVNLHFVLFYFYQDHFTRPNLLRKTVHT